MDENRRTDPPIQVLEGLEQGRQPRSAIGMSLTGKPKATSKLQSEVIKGNLRQDFVGGHRIPWFTTRGDLYKWMRVALLGIKPAELDKFRLVVDWLDKFKHNSPTTHITTDLLDPEVRRANRLLGPRDTGSVSTQTYGWSQLSETEFDFAERTERLRSSVQADIELALEEDRVIAVQSTRVGDRLVSPVLDRSRPQQPSSEVTHFLPLALLSSEWVVSRLVELDDRQAHKIARANAFMKALFGWCKVHDKRSSHPETVELTCHVAEVSKQVAEAAWLETAPDEFRKKGRISDLEKISRNDFNNIKYNGVIVWKPPD